MSCIKKGIFLFQHILIYRLKEFGRDGKLIYLEYIYSFHIIDSRSISNSEVIFSNIKTKTFFRKIFYNSPIEFVILSRIVVI